jgi:hypothetical protein
MLQMIALGDDHVIVPLLGFDLRLDLVRVAHGTDHLDLRLVRIGRIGLDHGFLAALGQDAAPLFLVQDAAVRLAGFEVGLVAADDRPEIALAMDLAPVLNSGIARDDPVGEPQFEVRKIAVGVDQEGVVGQLRVGLGHASDGAVPHRPERRVARPTVRSLPLNRD